MSNKIIGLKKEIEDEQTGVPSDFHILDSFFVAKLSKFVQINFASFYSQKAFESGKNPLSSRSVLI